MEEFTLLITILFLVDIGPNSYNVQIGRTWNNGYKSEATTREAVLGIKSIHILKVSLWAH